MRPMRRRRPWRGAGARVGQSLVEFTLIVMLLMLVTMGAIQTGISLYAAWVVVPGAVQDGASVAARNGATLEDGRQRTLALLAAGGVARLGRWQVTAEDLGDTVHVQVEGQWPLFLPTGGPMIRIAQEHSVSKEVIRVA